MLKNALLAGELKSECNREIGKKRVLPNFKPDFKNRIGDDMSNIDDIRFDLGLLPAVIQDDKTGKVLMLAYMNKESFYLTVKTGTTWFWSRSRNKLWNKGETSGNYQYVKNISYDCDGDALLIKVDQRGAACHTGNVSCFYREYIINNNEVK